MPIFLKKKDKNIKGNEIRTKIVTLRNLIYVCL